MAEGINVALRFGRVTNESLIGEQLDAGSLVPVLAAFVGSETPLHLVFVDRELMSPRMRSFIERAIAYFSGWGGDTDRLPRIRVSHPVDLRD